MTNALQWTIIHMHLLANENKPYLYIVICVKLLIRSSFQASSSAIRNWSPMGKISFCHIEDKLAYAA